MDIQEMHVGIDTELQKIGSAITQNLQPQEIDWFINKEVLKFIDERLIENPNVPDSGFQDKSTGIDSLRELVTTADIPSIKEGEETIIPLPGDYHRFVRLDLNSAKECTPAIVNGTKKEYKTEFEIILQNAVLDSYKILMTTDAGEWTLFDSAVDLPPGYLESLDIERQRFVLIKALQIVLPRNLPDALLDPITLQPTPFDLYWEWNKDDYLSQTFTLYTELPVYRVTTRFNNTNYLNNTVNYDITVYDNAKYPLRGNARVIDDEFFSDNVNSHLSNSTASSPIARIERNRIILNEPSGVVLGNAKLVYVCRPTLSDLLLSSSINMSRTSLDKIVANTVTYIKAVIQSPNYPTYKQENILIE